MLKIIQLGPSGIVQTAWALLTLLAVYDRPDVDNDVENEEKVAIFGAADYIFRKQVKINSSIYDRALL